MKRANLKMSKEQLKNLVAFCILMENDKGIITKSPDYIREKYERYMGGFAISALDSLNMQKYKDYIKMWLKEDEENIL